MTEPVEGRSQPKRVRPDKLRTRIEAADAALARKVLEALVELSSRFARRRAEIAAMRAELQEMEGRAAEAREKRELDAKMRKVGRIAGDDPKLMDDVRALLVDSAARGEPVQLEEILPKAKRGRPKGAKTKNRREPTEAEIAEAAAEAEMQAWFASAYEDLLADDPAEQREREKMQRIIAKMGAMLDSIGNYGDFRPWRITPGQARAARSRLEAPVSHPAQPGREPDHPPAPPSGGEAPTPPTPDLKVSEATASAPAMPPSDPHEVAADVVPEQEAAAAPLVADEPGLEPVAAAVEPLEESPQVDEEAARRDAAARDPLIVRITSLVEAVTSYRRLLKELGPETSRLDVPCAVRISALERLRKDGIKAVMEGLQPKQFIDYEVDRLNTFLRERDQPSEAKAVEARERIVSLARAILAR